MDKGVPKGIFVEVMCPDDILMVPELKNCTSLEIIIIQQVMVEIYSDAFAVYVRRRLAHYG